MGALPRKENGCLFFLVDEKQKKQRISLGTTFCRFIFNFCTFFSASNMSREYYDFVSFPIFAICLTYLLLTFFSDSFFFFLIEGGCFGWILLTINCTSCFRLFCGTEEFLEKTKIYFSVSSARI